MPFLVAEILNFQGSAHHVGVGSLSQLQSGYRFGIHDKILPLNQPPFPRSRLNGSAAKLSEQRRLPLL